MARTTKGKIKWHHYSQSHNDVPKESGVYLAIYRSIERNPKNGKFDVLTHETAKYSLGAWRSIPGFHLIWWGEYELPDLTKDLSEDLELEDELPF